MQKKLFSALSRREKIFFLTAANLYMCRNDKQTFSRFLKKLLFLLYWLQARAALRQDIRVKVGFDKINNLSQNVWFYLRMQTFSLPIHIHTFHTRNTKLPCLQSC